MEIILHDITNWERLDDLPNGALHAEGSLSKYLLRYQQTLFLFKETWTRRRGQYFEEVKHQFWSEIIAAAIGKCLNLDIPQTFIGINTHSDIPFQVGVLTQWFLKDSDVFVRGSELLTCHIENYDEKNIRLTE